MTVLRWILFLPAGFIGSVIAGYMFRMGAFMFSDIVGLLLSGFASAAGMIIGGLYVAPKRSAAVKWTLISLAALLGSFSAIGSLFAGDDKLESAVGISMLLGALSFFGIKTEKIINNEETHVSEKSQVIYNPKERAISILHLSHNVATTIAKKLCEQYPPSKKEPFVPPPFPREQEEAAISARISDMFTYLALERLAHQAVRKGDVWARDVWEVLNHAHLSIEEETRIDWLNRLEGDAHEFTQQVFQQSSDPFDPYRGSSIANAAENIEDSTFGILLRILLPDFYDSRDHQEVAEFLFPLLAQGMHTFLKGM